ncbi:MAG: hypothetical protein WCQ89_04425 [Verrucomicrobiota bacterium]
MNLLAHRPRSRAAAAIRERIFNVLPAASYQTEKLFGLLDIEFSTETATACVECRTTPRLLLNRDFVAEHCQADADLFLLILHELHHVILGHTRLFPRLTPLDNLVFDAVINAMLARSVGRSIGTGLFTRFYDYQKFPERLLRPPPGWPDNFEPALKNLPEAEARAIRLLYGSGNDSITYLDLYELLRASLDLRHVNFTLLGTHGAEKPDDPTLTQVIRRIVEGWPPPPFRIRGRDDGREPRSHWLREELSPAAEFQRAFAAVLRRCGLSPAHGATVFRSQRATREQSRETVVPDSRDRRASAFRDVFGHAPLLYRTPFSETKPRRLPAPVVHLYLDVSGSMETALPYLTAVCRGPFRRGLLKVFAFSTVVSELKGRNLTAATFANTSGTDINAVLRHLAGLPPRVRPRVALLATDGYVGPANRQLRNALGRTRVVAALTAPHYETDLGRWVHETIKLPSL